MKSKHSRTLDKQVHTMPKAGHDGWIEVRGARTHNLQDISVKLPRGQFVVISGVSGSGKSLLAFDTLYADG